METQEKNLERMLAASARGDVATVRAVLESGDVDVNGADEEGWTTLNNAAARGYLLIVELLLAAGADPNAATKDGWAPLHAASANRHLAIVELLLKAGADLNVADWEEMTPFHWASYRGRVQIVELLVKAGADPFVATKNTGETPLHYACKSAKCDNVRALLALGSDLHAKDNEGCEPLHCCIRPDRHRNTDIKKTLKTLQYLVSIGATWDAKCDELVSSGKAKEEAPALRVCMSLWSQELADGLPLTNIPREVINRGADSTQAYIDDLNKSTDIVLRRKICLVGCGCAGKTSLVKSITSEKPQLAHVDDRTIGIDHFPLRFPESATGSDGKVKVHEVTFWDFAGQDPYQVAHSLFFSPRTLYLVCVDLEAFTTAFLQASIMAFVKKQETQLMNEFIDRTVMRWIRMIVARQPDAEFEFIATKEDLLAENQVTGKLLKDMLITKLAEVETTVREMKNNYSEASAPSGTAAVAGIPSHPSVHFVSCASPESTQDARTKIEDLIIKSDRSFQMPGTYSQALAEIMRIREAAKHQDISKRIAQVFAHVDSLPEMLNIEPELCRTILQTLHDLGDVLWYEDLGVELFENTMILDPLLLIDFIRQVFNHKNTGQILPHADLKGMPYWLALDDDKQMEAMKTVLQKFHLVYPDAEDGVMEWDSDLIVPAYWQTKTPAAWLFLGDILRINTTQSCEGEAVRVHWEYHFEFGLSPSLFDHVVVASVSPYVKFDAGPDWIMYKEEEIAACRIMVGRDPKSLHRTIHVEAVVSEAASEEQVEKVWESFEQLCEAFVKVLRMSPGLKASSFALDDRETKISMKRLLRSKPKPSSRKWMPPAGTWEFFVGLMVEN